MYSQTTLLKRVRPLYILTNYINLPFYETYLGICSSRLSYDFNINEAGLWRFNEFLATSAYVCVYLLLMKDIILGPTKSYLFRYPRLKYPHYFVSSFTHALRDLRYYCMISHFCQPFKHLLSERLTSLGIMGVPQVPPLNPPETIVLSEHYRLCQII